jgi:hypothetical protein
MLATLHRVTWRASYAELLPPGTLDELDTPQLRRA